MPKTSTKAGNWDHTMRLAEACMAGNQTSCRALQNLNAAHAYRQNNRYRPELHRRAV